MTSAEMRRVGRQIRERATHLRVEDWSDPSQPASCNVRVIDVAYVVCESLELGEQRLVATFAYYADSQGFAQVLARVTTTGIVGTFEQALAALILLWHKRETGVDV